MAVWERKGNQPPWMLPARANYLVNYETPRAKAQFKHPGIRQPKDLMAVGMTILVRFPHPHPSLLHASLCLALPRILQELTKLHPSSLT